MEDMEDASSVWTLDSADESVSSSSSSQNAQKTGPFRIPQWHNRSPSVSPMTSGQRNWRQNSRRILENLSDTSSSDGEKRTSAQEPMDVDRRSSSDPSTESIENNCSSEDPERLFFSKLKNSLLN